MMMVMVIIPVECDINVLLLLFNFRNKSGIITDSLLAVNPVIQTPYGFWSNDTSYSINNNNKCNNILFTLLKKQIN
jgi:hypothetical protein